MLHPWPASAVAVAKPSPAVEPVTSAVLPLMSYLQSLIDQVTRPDCSIRGSVLAHKPFGFEIRPQANRDFGIEDGPVSLDLLNALGPCEDT